jgi:hypothetical protein
MEGQGTSGQKNRGAPCVHPPYTPRADETAFQESGKVKSGSSRKAFFSATPQPVEISSK